MAENVAIFTMHNFFCLRVYDIGIAYQVCMNLSKMWAGSGDTIFHCVDGYLLTHIGQKTPYWGIYLDQHLLRQYIFAWRLQIISWTKFD